MERRVWRLTILRMMGVTAAIAVVLAISNAVSGSQEAARRFQCTNNLKQLGLGFHNYAAANGEVLPYGTVVNRALPPEKRLSWYLVIWSYLDQVIFLFNLAETWEANENFLVKTKDGETGRIYSHPDGSGGMRCPSNRLPTNVKGPGLNSYIGIAGLGRDAPILPKSDRRAGVFGYDRQIALADIKDGTASTMIVAETNLANGPWTAGGPATVRGLDPAKTPYIGEGRQFGGSHPGGTIVLFVDGSVHFIRDTINPRTFEAFSTIAGGEQFAPLSDEQSGTHAQH